MNALWQDARYGARMLLKNKGFTFVAVLTLALGIGANTALFSVVDVVLLKKLPVKEPERLVLFQSVASASFNPGSYHGSAGFDEAGRRVRTSFPIETYTMFRAQSSSVCSDVFAFGDVTLNVNAGGGTDVANGQAVSGNYYAGLGVPALIGRTINDDDNKASAAPVAVLNYRYWQRRFGGDRAIVGRQINLNNVAFTVVGVTPQGFDGTMQIGDAMDVSIPLVWALQVNAESWRMTMGWAWWLRLMGRLKPGATAAQAQVNLANVFQQSVIENRAARQAQEGTGSPVINLKDFPQLVVASGSQGEMNRREFYQRPLYLLLATVGLVLLIACANVANLLLARAASRQKEIAVRLALGASRWRLIRQLLTESVLLAGLGGALGLLLAVWIKDGLLAVSDWGGSGMSALEPQLDLRVLGFTLALSIVTGLLFGIAPAWRATRVDLTPTLKDNARSSIMASRLWLTKSLVVAQVALTMLLLVGAGLTLRTLLNLQRVETGFNARNLLLFNVEPKLFGYKEEQLVNLYKQMFARLEAVPGVQSVTFSRHPPLAKGYGDNNIYLPDVKASAADGEVAPSGNVYLHQVRENFLEAMGIPLLAGRQLKAQDDERAPKVAVVNQTFARRFFPTQNPIGKRFGFTAGNANEIEIVGLAGDAKYTSQRAEIPPTAYLPWLQALRSVGSMTFEVRTAGDPSAAVAAIRQAVRDVDGNLPLNNIKTQIEQSNETLRMERLFAKLLSFFGLLAQTLAAVGLYGSLSYQVSRRTHEIGIRMALGAQGKDISGLVVKQGMMLVVAGVAIGLVAALMLTRVLASLLYGVTATDPFTFASVPLLVACIALLACYVPARRATKVDPLIALRTE